MGALTITLDKTATEEVSEEYVCTITANAVERDELGNSVPEAVSFSDDSWSTIAANVKAGNTDKYNIGDTKEVDLGSLGTHIVRLANKSTCTTETSETACGFVVEFADIITKQPMNSTSINVGGWPASEARTYINSTILNALPSDLQSIIVDTKVISGHGNTSGETNFTSIDKLYLLSTKEVWGGALTDTVNTETKQLDYYKNLGVTTSSCTGAIKQYNGSTYAWWLRAARSDLANSFVVVGRGDSWDYDNADYSFGGIPPAFRIA